VQEALDELRDLAHGIFPPLLADRGLCEALVAAARRAERGVRVDAQGVGRYEPEVEATVYFCCLEALQNVAKHAGDAACATVRIWEEEEGLRFEIADDGFGFDAAHRSHGAGLTNMTDRLGAIGGSLRVESAPGAGTRVLGAIPLPGRRS
jgi:signal transduction histidine kinase